MIGPDDHAGVRLVSNLNRSASQIAQPSHADLGQIQPGLDAAVDFNPGIDHPGPAGKSVGLDPKDVGLIRHVVSDLARGLVHRRYG